MTSLERVLAALKGEKSDRRAFTMTLSLYGAKLTGCPLTEYYTDSQRYLQGQIAVSEQCKPDILFTPFALSLEAQAFGSEIIYLEKRPPNVRKLIIRNPDDIGLLKVPDFENDHGLQYLLASTKLMAGQFKQRVPICGVLTSPLDLPAIIMGVETWLEILLFHHEKALAVIAAMSEYFVNIANKMFQNGAAFIAMAMVFTNPQIVMQKTISEIVLPSLTNIFSKVNGPIVFHHASMPIAKNLAQYRTLPNVVGFLLDQRDNLTQARSAVGGETLLLGNLEGPTLGKISPARALEKARKILEETKDDRHFIFATSSADVAWDTPLETISGIHDLMDDYGEIYE